MISLASLAAILLALAGIIGAIIPAIPGPPISFIALLITYYTCPGEISSNMLIVFLILTVIVTILDYIAPAWMTDKFGGSKYATRGSLAGLIIGLFFGPLGMIVGPFIGAFIGELIYSNRIAHALKIGMLSFLSFILTTGIKLIICSVMMFFVVSAMI